MLRGRGSVDRIYIGVAVCLVACLVLHIVLFFQMRESLLATQLELVAAQARVLDLSQQVKATSRADKQMTRQEITSPVLPSEGPEDSVEERGSSSLYVPIDPQLSCETRFGSIVKIT